MSKVQTNPESLGGDTFSIAKMRADLLDRKDSLQRSSDEDSALDESVKDQLDELEVALSRLDSYADEGNEARAKRIYGLDGYSRYVEVDGEHYAVETYPFVDLHLLRRLSYRLEVIRWHLGMIRQYGVSEWRRVRKF